MSLPIHFFIYLILPPLMRNHFYYFCACKLPAFICINKYKQLQVYISIYFVYYVYNLYT